MPSSGDTGDNHPTRERQSDSLGDPEFQLKPNYRRRLTTLGQAQYEAARRDERSRVDRLRAQLVDDPPVGTGIGRSVYPLPETSYTHGRYDEYVLKLPSPDYHDSYGYERDGRVQNRAEAALWSDCRSPTAWLVPVVAADQRGHWLIMPRGESIDSDADWLDAWTARVVEAHGLSSSHGHDIDPQNIVRLNGDARLCDYGLLTS